MSELFGSEAQLVTGNCFFITVPVSDGNLSIPEAAIFFSYHVSRTRCQCPALLCPSFSHLHFHLSVTSQPCRFPAASTPDTVPHLPLPHYPLPLLHLDLAIQENPEVNYNLT